MIRFAFLAAPLLLAACAEEPAAETDDAPTSREIQAAIEDDSKEKLSPPDRDVFAAKFADACPTAKKVNKASCRAQGMGSHDFTCEYGLGDDDYLRHEGTLSEVEGEWVLLETEKVCAQGA